MMGGNPRQAFCSLGREIVLHRVGSSHYKELPGQCREGNPRASARRKQDRGVDCVDIFPLQLQRGLFNLGLPRQVADDDGMTAVGKNLQQVLFKSGGVTVDLPGFCQRLCTDGSAGNYCSQAQCGGKLPSIRSDGSVADRGSQRKDNDERGRPTPENRRRPDAAEESGRL